MSKIIIKSDESNEEPQAVHLHHLSDLSIEQKAHQTKVCNYPAFHCAVADDKFDSIIVFTIVIFLLIARNQVLAEERLRQLRSPDNWTLTTMCGFVVLLRPSFNCEVAMITRPSSLAHLEPKRESSNLSGCVITLQCDPLCIVNYKDDCPVFLMGGFDHIDDLCCCLASSGNLQQALIIDKFLHDFLGFFHSDGVIKFLLIKSSSNTRLASDQLQCDINTVSCWLHSSPIH